LLSRYQIAALPAPGGKKGAVAVQQSARLLAHPAGKTI
jgi:hypothetical protein